MSAPTKSQDIQPQILQSVLYGPARAKILNVALQLDLFSLIHHNQTTLDKLTKQLNLPLRSARFLLDALVGMGLLQKLKSQYKLGHEAATFLVRGESRYIGAYLLGVSQFQDKWDGLSDCLKSGKPVTAAITPEAQTLFFQELAKALFSVNYLSAVHLAKKLGLGKTIKAPRILDVACGAAPWSIACALADTGCQIVAMDLPGVLQVAQEQVQKFRLGKQFQFLGGDLKEFNFGVEAFDLIILGHICHGVGEAETRRLLKKAYDALKVGGKIIVAEFLVNDLRTAPEVNLLFAMNMLLSTEQGDVFSIKDFKRWLGMVGFKKTTSLNLLHPTQGVVATK
ncbi:MAG: methyltransferase domain-containing protein [Deltaproteobacteria bacterium]|nr:methyltransferase domain-containing protein [Deltaproteobacteria bacterium]